MGGVLPLADAEIVEASGLGRGIAEAARIIAPGEEKMDYYNVSVGWNVLPGEIFIGRNRAKATSLYVIAGVGNTTFVNQRRQTYNFGAGSRVFLADWAAFQIDVRDHIFTHDLLGLFTDFVPRHARRYADLGEQIKDAVRKAVGELLSCPFCLSQWVGTGAPTGADTTAHSPVSSARRNLWRSSASRRNSTEMSTAT